MDSMLEQLVIVYMAQINSAMKISEILTEHSEEDEITPDSLITGLVYRLMIPMSQDEMEETMDGATNTMNDFLQEDEDDEIEEEDYIVLEQEPRMIITNTCTCKICSTARDCLRNYHTHICSDPLAEKYKQSIKYACDKHKLLI